MGTDERQPPSVLLAVDLVILTLRSSGLNVLLVERGVEPFLGTMALPGGFIRDLHEDIAAAASRELSEETGLDADTLHLEHLCVYGTPGRDPRGRVVSVAYLAIAPRLPEPVAGTDASGACWAMADDVLAGRRALAFDHQRIVADGVERARAKLECSALATAFCGPTFTISELQQVYEAVWGVRLDPRNFYRKIQGASGFVVPVGPVRKPETGRPARLFRPGPSAALFPPMTRPGGPAVTDAAVMPGHEESALPAKEASTMNPPPGTTVAILTALDVEYLEIRARLTRIRVRTHAAGTRFEVGYLGDHGCVVALTLVGKGNLPAAVLAERAIAEFGPAAVMFVGVAGALWPKVALGDVVTATHVYAYHGATSEDDGEKARPRTWPISHRVLQVAQHLARDGGWARGLEFGGTPPRAHFGPIAAGEVVQDSAKSGNARWIREHYNDALAIEMEAAGVAQASHLNDSLPMIVIRGISDRADGTKTTTDRAGWQPRAAANAAAFAAALATALAEDRAFSQHGPHPAAPGDDDTTGRPVQENTNIAKGNARVGIQAGQIFGDARLGPDAGPGAGALMAPAIAVISKGRLMAAVRRLCEFTVSAADLTVELAAAIAAARGVT